MPQTKILITGAAGFIGQLLSERFLSDPQYSLILTDIIEPPIHSRSKHPENAKCVKADLSDPTSLDSLLETALPGLDAIYVFHGIMSSGSEADFELGMRVNLSSTMALLEGLRKAQKSGQPPLRVIYASSQAVYGPPLPPYPEPITEAYHPTPASSYGTQKLVVETLINDYTRKGFINALSMRFPTISVRPGKPTQAASSFLSGMIREPFAGLPSIIPLKDRSFRSWLCSPKTLATNLIHALTLDLSKLDSHRRVVNAPGIGVSIQEMLNALSTVGGLEKLKLIKEEEDQEMERILRSWGTEFDNSLAYSLGFQKDVSFEEAVRDYAASLKE